MKRLKAELDKAHWTGCAVAVNAEKGDLEHLLRSEGLMDREVESLVAIELYMGEDYGGRMQIPHIRALMADGRDSDRVVQTLAASGDTLSLRAVEAHVTIEEFVSLFKHFKIVLTRSDLDLDGRAYDERS
jgi:hypothetical protein